jgi:hypothetical protein
VRKQRNVDPGTFRRRKSRMYWSPRVREGGRDRRLKDAGSSDWYAVVDDIGEGVVRLEIADWPELDQGGHLHFTTLYDRFYPLDAFQQLVNRARRQLKQPAVDRPLRIGDAFRIRSEGRLAKELPSGGFQGTLQDISEAARGQAKIAMYGAVARRVNPDEAKERQQGSRRPSPFQRGDNRGRNLSRPVKRSAPPESKE